MMLNEDQALAVYKGEEWWRDKYSQVLEISGPAGTGKTFLVKYLIERFGLRLDEVLFVAYMGKAVMAMSRNGLPAKTIHSTIYDYVKVLDKKDGKIQLLPNGNPKVKFEFVRKEKINDKIRLIVVDEGSMISEKIGNDLLSFNLPIIVLGDLNQLPPPFGRSFFLKKPDIELHQIMRQSEDSPIIYLSQKVLNGEKLKKGIYGNCAVIDKSEVDEYKFTTADIILTGTNRLRYSINQLFREHLIEGIKMEYPNIGEKLVCRKNNWNKSISNNIYLTTGMTGYVDYVDLETYNGKQIKIDFRPDFTDKVFKHLTVDYERLYTTKQEDLAQGTYDFTRDKFEFAYAITTHMSQGSQFENVLFMAERMGQSESDYKKFLYTGITRATNQLTIAI